MHEKLQAMRTAVKNGLKAPSDIKAISDVLLSTLLKDELFNLVKETSKNENYLTNLCHNFKYEIASKGDVIFAQGDVSNQNFYVIVNGKVGVFVNYDLVHKPIEVDLQSNQENNMLNYNARESKRSQDDGLIEKGYFEMMKQIFQTDIKEGGAYSKNNKSSIFDIHGVVNTRAKRLKPVNMANNKQFLLFSKLMNDNIYQQINNTINKAKLVEIFEEYYIKDETMLKDYEIKSYEDIYGKYVRYLDSGHYFGEKAIEEQKTRSATIIALTNTEFLTLSRNDYQLCIQNALRKNKMQILEFFIKALNCSNIYKDMNFYYTLVNGFNVNLLESNIVQKRMSI